MEPNSFVIDMTESVTTNNAFLSATKIPALYDHLRIDGNYPVTHLLGAPLPPLSADKDLSDDDILLHFSTENPDRTTHLDPLSIPVPCFAIRLQRALLPQWKLGTRSLFFKIDKTLYHLDLWWAELWVVFTHQIHGRNKWRHSRQWCNTYISSQPVDPLFAHVPLAMDLLFAIIPWDLEIATSTGTIRTLRLTELLSNRYLPGQSFFLRGSHPNAKFSLWLDHQVI